MIIDTNGFEIGDEVWLPNLLIIPCKPIKLKIKSFIIDSYGVHVYVFNRGWDKAIYIGCLHSNEQDCKDECKDLNEAYYD